MKNISLIISFMLILFISCMQEKEVKTDNPFLVEYDTPYQIPPFEQIELSHFMPAYQQGIAEQNANIDAIIKSKEEPSFENVILAFEYSGALLDKVSSVFGNMMSMNTSDSLQALAKEITPMMSKHGDEIFLNPDLFTKVKAVYEKRESIGLEGEQAKLLEETYKGFVKGGANLPEDKKEVLKGINEKLSMLSLQFGENLLKETNSFEMLLDEKDLSGLPESVKIGAAEAAKDAGHDGKWMFTLHKPSWIPFIQYSDRRDLREKIYKAMYNRANNDNEFDNKDIISQIIKLRVEKAHIMGFESHAARVLDDRMAKEPQKVYDLLEKLWYPALNVAKAEALEMQKMIDSEGGNFKLESWDWWYYAEKVRKAKFNLDESELRPYFMLDNVRKGSFILAEKLYGIKFKELNNVPVPHPDAKAFEVTEANGNHIGIYFVDYFPRESKRAGAWMSSYRKQSNTIDGKNISPIITNVCNFSKPTGGKPALLSFDEVSTLFHEFGHGLHGLLSNCKYNSLSGTSVPRDFVELPSQIMENWVPEPEMLKLFATHYETGEVIPQELIDKLSASGKFNQGFVTVEYLAASLLDMEYHTITDVTDINVANFEEKSMKKYGLIDEIIPRYKTTYFNHIWASGYSAGYYSYIWAEVLDADAFEAFKETGDIFNKNVATAFRNEVISRGGTEDAMKMYLKFRGQEPSIEPLLEKRGLN